MKETLNGKRTLFGAFAQHRRDAKKRSIEFFFTYKEWLKVWKTSGHLKERGYRKGQYVMARYGDKGPYSKDNVEIITAEQNHIDGNIGRTKVMSAEARRKISMARRGTKLSKEHKQAIARGLKGKTKGIPKTKEHRRKMSEAMKGRRVTFSLRHRKNLALAAKRRWKEAKDAGRNSLIK